MLICFRGSVGAEYPEYYIKSWEMFKFLNEHLQEISKDYKGYIPELKFSQRSGLCIIDSKQIYIKTFLIETFFKNIKPIFYYELNNKKIKDTCLFPVYLGLLKESLNSNNVLKLESIKKVLSNDFQLKSSKLIINNFLKFGILKQLSNDKFRISCISQLFPQVIRRAGDTKEKYYSLTDNDITYFHDEDMKIFSFLRVEQRHLYSIISILSKVQNVLKGIYKNQFDITINNWIDFEIKIFPLIHQMLDNYLYLEANDFILKIINFSLPNFVQKDEKKKIIKNFNYKVKNSWGYRFIEACEPKSIRDLLVILPRIPKFIESGRLKDFKNNGIYQLIPLTNYRRDYA